MKSIFGMRLCFSNSVILKPPIAGAHPGHHRALTKRPTTRGDALAKRILLDLRDALADGGVAYLDEHGRNAYGPAAMFAFVLSVRRNGLVTGLNLLRVDEDALAAFLATWADWLTRQDIVMDAPNEHSAIAA